MNDFIQVPLFSRIHDWVGVWAMEVGAFELMRRAAAAIQWQSHMAAAPLKVASTLDMQQVGKKTIAVIRAAGTLMKSQSSMGGTSTVQLRRDLRAAANDPQVSGVLLAIDSPGGTAAGTWELGNAVGQVRRKKPIFAWVDEMAASAAYWAASQASAIYAANPSAFVGSIGTYQAVYDYSEAAAAQGVKVHVATTGPLKGMGVQGSRVTDEQISHVQSIVDELQTHFDKAVRSGRGMTAAQLEQVRSGAIFSAAQAIDLRLIDGIKGSDQVLESLAAAV